MMQAALLSHSQHATWNTHEQFDDSSSSNCLLSITGPCSYKQTHQHMRTPTICPHSHAHNPSLRLPLTALLLLLLPLVPPDSTLVVLYATMSRVLMSNALDSQQPTFDLDPAALEKRYKLLQWQLHPDKSVRKTPQEQQYSADQATLVNQAYGVLRQPLSRANYMVSA